MSHARRSTITHRGPVFDVEMIEYEDGAGRPVRRDIVRHPGAVTVVGELADGRVVFIRNYREAVGGRLLELPAGKLEPGEDPAEAARRELREETGYAAVSIEPLGTFYTSPGMSDERMHVFAARGLEAGATALEPGEAIEVELLEVDVALAMAQDGGIEDGKTIAALTLWSGSRGRATLHAGEDA